MNRYLVYFYIGNENYSYPIEAENSDQAYKEADKQHAKLNRPEPDAMSITYFAAIRPKLESKIDLTLIID